MSSCLSAVCGSAWVNQSIGAVEFILIIALLFALFMIFAGVFTAYFGSGKSRSIGVALLVVGLVVGFGSAYYYHVSYPGHLFSLLGELVVVLVASIIGALIAVGVFLVAIMKS